MPGKVARELERCWSASADGDPQHALIPLELEDRALRLAVFSDQHRGTGDRADDFRRCAPAYAAALEHYFAAGYTLLALGDAEELWENRPGKVLGHYADALRGEARFLRAGRYWRFWGNHDDEWRHADAVTRHLAPLGLGCPVWESLRMPVTLGGEPVGTLLFVHGHQGTLESDRFGGLSRLAVRWLWRPFQRLTGATTTTPATHYELRQGHDGVMYDWASGKGNGLVLITGHTHRPVFESLTHLGRLRLQLREVERRLVQDPGNGALLATRETLRVNIAHRLAAEGLLSAGEAAPPSPVEGRPVAVTPVGTRALNTPCYFNTGCCCFPDGDVTGIEIADGLIRLVRWPDDDGAPRGKVLAEAELLEVFARCGGRVGVPA